MTPSSVKPDMKAIDAEPASATTVTEEYMLSQRVISSTILLPLGVLAVAMGGPLLTAAAGLVGAVMAYEWARMQDPARATLQAIILGAGAIACAALSGIGEFHWMAPCLVVFALAAAALRASWIGRLESFCGAVYVAAPGAVFVWIRNRPEDGLIVAFAIVIGVWASDIAAYFVGKAFGGPKISPETSPKKTWSGFFGGVVAAALAVALFAVAAGANWLLGLATGVVISVIGQAGDLFESLVKRHFRVKDASGFIPGHGGVLDRLDSLMAASLVCALALRWVSTIAPNANLASATPF